ncbi:two-component system sensor histidine kinase MtrB [Streptomyces sp. Amel2xB2]|uniref:LpqB family beta-propeller domain-containing protein n=1 Tax=Streptomyces sp. Amel2xB2 TaxID=1305829 RepID=UPI000DB9C214|nr:LpqB family beta-propeller domain-containing protein [Streptomyces sp. Amel2xB2]RAJ69614.1 two-component system sensor histidine kinase MtrB [Streptomyces sp. Amel2xB2]
MRSDERDGQARQGQDARVGLRSRRGRRAVAVQLTALVVLLSGCASMPDDGTVDHVDSSHRAESDSQVRVFGVSPQKGEKPQQIVRGFLEATTSDEAAFSTAKEYLTDSTAAHWDPFASTSVVSGGPSPANARRDAGGGGGSNVQVTGTRVAEVDDRHAYSPKDGDYNESFHLTKDGGEWRIDHLPDGLVLGESDFQRIYRPINNYYYAELGPDAEAITGGKDVLVADPVFLRRRIDPVTATVNALLDGPTGWLDPVVDSSFPEGARIAPGQRLSLDDSGALNVRLNSQGAKVSQKRCVRMAFQMLYTVQDQASAKVSKVVLADAGGRTLCERTREDAEDYQPGRLNGRASHQYFVDGDHRVSSFDENSDDPKPVKGALGQGETEMGAVAVNRTEHEGAAVSRARRSLYVTSLSEDSKLGDPVLTSKAKHEKERLTAPSWDGLGDLWIADRDPDDPRLLRIPGGKETPEEVDVPQLAEGERIESLRIASDGVRMALHIREKDGSRTLKLGRVQRTGTPQEPQLSVTSLRPLAPQFEDVSAVSWAGGSRLVVVGRESGSVQQMQYFETDGASSNQPTLPGINDVTGVAASEDESKPLLADSEDGIVRLPPDANWKTLTDSGTSPAYPG